MSTVTEVLQNGVEANLGEPIFEHRQRSTVDPHQMAVMGLLGDDPLCELIGGVVVAMMSKNPSPILSSDLIDALLHRNLLAGILRNLALMLVWIAQSADIW